MIDNYETHSAGDITLAQIPKDILMLAGRLRGIHGTITIADESKGIHLYMASPAVLEQEGDKELRPPGQPSKSGDGARIEPNAE